MLKGKGHNRKMLVTTARRLLFSGFLVSAITLVFGSLRFYNGLADQQEYTPGLSIRSPGMLKEYMVWPVMAVVLPAAVLLMQYLWERFSNGNKNIGIGRILLSLLICYPLCVLATYPSFFVTYSPYIWDNFDPALKWFPYLCATTALLLTNALSVITQRKQQHA
jgi:hypothetical protein